METRVIQDNVEIARNDVRDGVLRPLIAKFVSPSKIQVKTVSGVNGIRDQHLGIEFPSGQLIEHLIIRKTAAHNILVSNFAGQVDVGYVILSDVILTFTRNGQKALRDFQVRDLGVLVPLTVQIHKGTLPLEN